MLSKIQEITVFVVYDYNFTEFMPFNVFGEEFVAQMWLEVGRSRVGSWLSKTNNNYYRSKNKKLQCIRKTLLLSPECCFIKFCIVFVSFTKGPVSRLQLT